MNKGFDACKELHNTALRGVRYSFDSITKKFVVSKHGKKLGKDYVAEIPKNGIYVMFENGELWNGKEKIVRVGINVTQNNLADRIKRHYMGSIRTSVFRKHIASCFDSENLSKEELEKKVSNYIQNNISFVVFAIDDQHDRVEYEKKFIGTVASCVDCIPSINWLGKKCMAPEIKSGNLWNRQHLNSKPLTEEELIKHTDKIVLDIDLSKDFKEFLND